MTESEADRDRVLSRAERPTVEERKAGSCDPVGQAAAILEDSDVRSEDRAAAPGTVLEQRTSDEATPPA